MKPAKIMIVEDERISAEYLQAILTQLGYTVTAQVSSGSDALREAERTHPDLAIMDIRIKGPLDGTETACKLRERFGVPSLYLTAHADPETQARAKLAEPLGYVVKPFEASAIQANIEMALHRRESECHAKQREEQLSSTLSAMGEGVVWTDGQGLVTFLNTAAQRWTGRSEEEGVGKKIEDVLQLRPSNARQVFERVQSEKKLVTLGEASIATKTGSELVIGGTAAPISSHSEGIAGVVFVFGGQASPRSIREIPTDNANFLIIVESAAMRHLTEFARRVARSEASTILIEGESGTGKDILAKYVHYHSSRKDEPFLALNCAAIPETLLESELFGYEKGAFTDAKQQKRGILELATKGTVFLDEVGEMPLAIQAKLLRVLEEQCFRRLGGVKDIKVDLRVITASNRDLREATRDGRFRLDLYYRINVIQLSIPPLRERPDDILPLANHFLDVLNQKFKRPLQGISREAAQILGAYDWPGNVREVRNMIERALILEETDWIQASSIDIHNVSRKTPDHAGDVGFKLADMSLAEAERTLVVNALEKSHGNQTQAARALGITRDTLRYKMKKFGLPKARAAGA
jgi:two-component system, NtrC family, response regulator AtoC